METDEMSNDTNELKPKKRYSLIKGAMLVSFGLFVGHNYSSKFSVPQSMTDQAIEKQMNQGFTYLESTSSNTSKNPQIEPQLSEIFVASKLQKEFGKHVFLKKISNSNLYLAVVDSKSFYVDVTGRYLLKGQLFDIDNKVVASNLIEAELANLASMTNAITNSVVSNSSAFIENHSNRPTSDKIGIATQKSSEQVGTRQSLGFTDNPYEEETTGGFTDNPYVVNNTTKPTSVLTSSNDVKADSEFKRDNEVADGISIPIVEYNVTHLPISLGDDDPLPPTIIERAKNLNLFSTQFRSECFNLVMEADSFVDMYKIFNEMPLRESETIDVKKACGNLMAGKHISVIPDESLVVYEAPNSKRSITIVSDYTCPYCKKAHNEIPKYLENGITVRVFPYGRYSYRAKDGSGTIFSQNMDILTCQNSEDRVRAMDELTNNPRKFSRTLLQGYAPVTDECRQQTYIYKVLGDVLVRKETPMIISDKGDVASGYFPYGTILSDWNML